MPLDREAIASLIPHAGAMCLLDRVIDWDATSIRCVSHRHRALDNPLRRASGLGGLCGVEFGAQAMAVHGRLVAPAGSAPRAGYLASLRDVTCRERRLDLLGEELVVTAERLAGDEHQALYRFSLACAGVAVMDGRATVLLGVAPP